MTKLSVNLNAVAQLRNRRNLPWPSVAGIARICLVAGADGVTVHPRPDERHTRRTDVYELKALIDAEFPDREFNVEGYPDETFLALVEEVRPHQVTLVPDAPGQSTSDHGWDIAAHKALLRKVTARLKGAGMRVSLFIDGDAVQPALAFEAGADRVELYTGPYAHPQGQPSRDRELKKLVAAAEAARSAGHNSGVRPGLEINAGHDLTLDNLPQLMGAIPDIAEASIGHGITADALILGFAEAVRRYRAALERA